MRSGATRDGAILRAHECMDGGAYLEDLARRVAIPTESQVPEQASELYRYQKDEIGPSFEKLGFDCTLIDNPVPDRGPAMVATRIEDPSLPTVLIYGHGDVVRGLQSEWRDGLEAFAVTIEGDKVYGRGVVDNKGQHTLAMSAMGAVLEERGGKLGFNAKFIIETGEEQGSPGLKKIVEDYKDLLSCDMFLGFDGPRKSISRMDLNLGCRGGVFFDLIVDLNRPGGMHSGHWGGVLPDAGIILAHAIGTIISKEGQIQIKEWLPESVPAAVLEACRDLVVDPLDGSPEPDPNWGQPGITAREKTIAYTSFVVLAYSTGNPDNPVNAVPSYAKARCQVRYTVDVERELFIPALRKHLDENGLRAVEINTNIGRDQFPASRTDPDHAWVTWVKESIVATTGTTPNVLPCSAGSNPSELFKAGLNVPVVWVPHSYGGCNQHGADEHGLKSMFREGIGVVAGLFWDLGDNATPQG